jgi:hypothetical protein
MDLHLISRVYLAGGPGKVNNWGQELIRNHLPDEDGSKAIEREQIPEGIRDHLHGYATVGGTIWSDLTRVRIEMGGGFYHYGVVIYPTGTAPPPNWWQRMIGWPPEVVVYHETD